MYCICFWTGQRTHTFFLIMKSQIQNRGAVHEAVTQSGVGSWEPLQWIMHIGFQMLIIRKQMKHSNIYSDNNSYIPGEGMMECWFRKGFVSVDSWLAVVLATGRPGATWELAEGIVGLGSALGLVGCGFINWARGSKPEFKSCIESRDEAEMWTGGRETMAGLAWAIGGWLCSCETTGPLERDCGGLFTSLLEVFFFCCLGTSPGTQTIGIVYQQQQQYYYYYNYYCIFHILRRG